MLNQFKIGDKVSFLYEKREGIVKEIVSSAKVKVEDDHGFMIEIQSSDLCLIESNNFSLDGLHSNRLGIKEEKGRESKKSGKRRSEETWEIDLHAHEILESTLGLTNTEILRKQCDVCRTTINKARKLNIRNLVFIHGVGEGVLRESIRQILFNSDDVSFEDADPKKYGNGATQVRLHY